MSTAPIFQFDPEQIFYSGKVRDVYSVRDKIIIIASDRISAFDYILPKTIPFKGQVLNQLAAWFLRNTAHLVPNWLENVPFPNCSVGKKCQPVMVEMVVRGYLAGHAARLYKSGQRAICGVNLPNGLNEGDLLPKPIITPTTKALYGHDMDISREAILAGNLVSSANYEKMEKYAMDLFEFGQQVAKSRNLILVDTKYEFGVFNGDVLLMDEIHTPDSSRYYYLEGYEQRQQNGEKQRQLSKEFVREWLMENSFSGQEGQHMPKMSDEFVEEISNRYIKLYELMTGETFRPNVEQYSNETIENTIKKYLNY
jgi:phosphoribosylaminoimidazole-succinocarboxamide synthase